MTPAGRERDALKRRAAERAVEEVRSGMVLGLGSGSTMDFVLKLLSRKIAGGLGVIGIPSSRRTATLAHRLGIPLSDFATHRRIDLTIDGADQVARRSLDLVKGLGGALLREKIIAGASERVLIVVDQSKLGERLDGRTPLPVEVVQFGHQLVMDRLVALGATPVLRRAGGEPMVTDNGNLVIDCQFPEIPDPAALEARLRAIAGVVATGLFLGMADSAVVAGTCGVEVLRAERRHDGPPEADWSGAGDRPT